MKHRTLAYLSCCIIGLIGLITLSCSRQPDVRLQRAESMMSDSLPQARAILDSIDRTSLSEADRNLHDLLVIKVKDKSDSIIPKTTIQNLTGYYLQNGDSSRYAEALYYEGRMFCQHGNYQNALKSFRMALSVLPETESNLYLRGLILSQTGRRLSQMRVYDEAQSYIQESIKIDSVLKDTLGLIYDLELSGAINVHTNNLEVAEKIFSKSLKLSTGRYAEMNARQRMYLSAILYKKGKQEDALNAIRGIPEEIADSYVGTALGYASQIYFANNILDTAYMYAVQLERMTNANNRKAAYRILLSDKLRGIVPDDSIRIYAERYTTVSENFISKNGKSSSIIQNSHFNYKDSEKARQKAESSFLTTKIILIGVISFLICTVIFTVFLCRRYKRIRLNESKTRNELTLLKSSLFNPNRGNVKDEDSLNTKELKDMLLKELIEGCENNENNKEAPPAGLRDSAIFQKINKMCLEGINIPDGSSLWSDLERQINEIDPDFSYRVNLLISDCKQKEIRMQHIMLIKCGFNSKQVATLVAKTGAAINHRRKILANIIFGDSEKVNMLDSIISRL